MRPWETHSRGFPCIGRKPERAISEAAPGTRGLRRCPPRPAPCVRTDGRRRRDFGGRAPDAHRRRSAEARRSALFAVDQTPMHVGWYPVLRPSYPLPMVGQAHHRSRGSPTRECLNLWLTIHFRYYSLGKRTPAGQSYPIWPSQLVPIGALCMCMTHEIYKLYFKNSASSPKIINIYIYIQNRKLYYRWTRNAGWTHFTCDSYTWYMIYGYKLVYI